MQPSPSLPQGTSINTERALITDSIVVPGVQPVEVVIPTMHNGELTLYEPFSCNNQSLTRSSGQSDRLISQWQIPPQKGESQGPLKDTCQMNGLFLFGRFHIGIFLHVAKLFSQYFHFLLTLHIVEWFIIYVDIQELLTFQRNPNQIHYLVCAIIILQAYHQHHYLEFFKIFGRIAFISVLLLVFHFLMTVDSKLFSVTAVQFNTA
ncbi:Hypothetical_protein [Hexamita inflata]|uniref:Hypothetical_protein n=1 Tax=Hexamita inflata TaxID=28002 RepID=A0AA86R571_9EUKA|nr:Hypothetical protein HINF_LOCUS57222 [Hexamita inflata]